MGPSAWRRTVRSATAVAAVATLFVAISSPSSFAQDVGARIHVAIADGPFQGEHDASVDIPCQADFAGPGSWSVGGFSPTFPLQNFSVYLAAEGGGFEDEFRVLLVDEGTGDQSSYLSTGISFEVDDRGSSATLSGTGEIQDEYSSGPGIPVEVTVECLSVSPPGRTAGSSAPTAVPPTPQVQGPPPAGSSVVDLTLGFGSWAGSYLPWTLEDACFVSEGTWLVTLQDANAIPWSVSFVGAEAEGEDPQIGLLTVWFGRLPDATVYQTSAEAAVELDPRGSARIVDEQAIARLSDGTTIEGQLEASVECAGVVP